MNALGIFDETRALARLLMLLNDEDRDGLSMLNMYRLMKATYSVARTAVDSSLQAALKLGLVEQHTSQRFMVTILTLKGIATAVKLKELETILSRDSVI
jgi:hypothetical protein